MFIPGLVQSPKWQINTQTSGTDFQHGAKTIIFFGHDNSMGEVIFSTNSVGITGYMHAKEGC